MKSASAEERKVWICLFTCCSSRAVHFEAVLNMTSDAFRTCFRRFVARRSGPSLVVSDNVKTFKSASKELEKIANDPSVVEYFCPREDQMVLQLREGPMVGRFLRTTC